ncbi:dr1-associated corepressor isoform X2 [Gadus morhua]|uniref:dr1-associated corepressor isoform X2 n=1 Tax=Gadus morhua TaxID=8049 RepID=UPI0011B63097|nr:dr1-associated corepressor-like isoform X2 [Gadus morhua]
MPARKRKPNVRFSPGRIKKMMQKDAEVGRIAAVVPVLISRALELLVRGLLVETCLIAQAQLSSIVLLAHMKQCIESEKRFHFLNELTETATTITAHRDARTLSMWSLYRTKPKTMSVKEPLKVAERTSKTKPRSQADSSSDSDSPLYICL